MTDKLKKTPWGSFYTSSLSRGCQQCIGGEKLVVLVATDCSSKCFYCPLSLERMASRDPFANERPIKNVEDLTLEASNMEARGASMTGGDPLEQHSFSQTLEFCRILKQLYSESFHIHLYTRGKELTFEKLSLMSPFIDEIRFHVVNIQKDLVQVQLATQFDLDIGIEVPVIPTKGFNYYRDLITYFEDILPAKDQFYFINLNELEISETNYRNLIARGLKSNEKNPSAVEGSYELGEKIVNWASNHVSLPVHFCSLATKDRIQLPNRIYRIAKKTKLPSDVIIPDGSDKGLLLRGVIQSPSTDLDELHRTLIDELEIQEEIIHIDHSKNRLLTNAAILDELKDEIRVLFPDVILGIAEEYPTYDNLQTTFIPLD
ncbi:MAG: 4Fe-4S cluster-binding domain-containing protein [Candidatus Heimdallarchaeota archaeon]|nr:MAG: 4Fe-4S cluster-binding domain-containing protein [Candidatus Heimdallarchaeota archaeon]